MTRAITFTIAAIAFVYGTAAAAPLVTYESPCECRDYHGKGRLTEKNDAALPPTDPNAIQAVTPSDIFSWQGPTEPLTRSSGRWQNKFTHAHSRVITRVFMGKPINQREPTLTFAPPNIPA